MMPVFPHNFTGDLKAIDWFGEPFALSRYGDGELACINRKPFSPMGAGAGTETWDAGRPIPLHAELVASLEADVDGYYIGAMPACCQNSATAPWIKAPPERLVASTLFCYANHERFQAITKRLELRARCCLVSGKGGDIEIPLDAINRSDWLEPTLEAMFAVRGKPILVAAGPAACVLVHQYWLRAPERSVCVDIGSAWDIELWGHGTRMHTAGATKKRRGNGDPMGMRFHECKLHDGSKPCHPGCKPARF